LQNTAGSSPEERRPKEFTTTDHPNHTNIHQYIYAQTY
jgi:hypothetical protein